VSNSPPGLPVPVNYVGPPDAAQLAADAFTQRDVEVRRLWTALWRRRTLLALVFFGFFAAVAAFTFLQPKHYTTEVKMIAGSSSAAIDQSVSNWLPLLNALRTRGGAQTSETYAELLHEWPVAQEVTRRLRLPMTPRALLTHVSIKPVTNTNVITIAVSWRDARTSARIANEFAKVFVDRERELIATQAESVIGFLRQRLPGAQARMHAAQGALAAYQRLTGIADLSTESQTKMTALADLDTKRQAAEISARQAQAQLTTVTSLLASTPPVIVGQRSVRQNPVTGQLDTQIAQTQVDLNAALQQYTELHPTVVALKAKLEQLERQKQSQSATVVAQTDTVPNPVYQQLDQQRTTLQAQLSAAQAQAATLEGERAQLLPSFGQLPEEGRRIGDLQREVRSTEAVYTALEQKYQEALIARTTAPSDVAITQPADPTVASVSPNVLFNLAIAVLVGLMLAISTVFLVEFFDDRFRTEDDVKERLGLPVLATIPLIDPSDKKTSAWVEPLSVESFLQLVASLRYSSSRPPRTIAITSPERSDGKSTIAIKTAMSMAMMNARVLVIDADLRRPSIHTKLGVPNDRGLSDVLVGVLPLAAALKPSGQDGVWVLTSGRRAPNPVALLQSEGFDRLLDEAREQFDCVIIDSPALRAIVDSVVIGVKVEGTILVVSAAKSDGRSVHEALAKLRSVRGMNLLGIVLNETKPEMEQYSDGYLGAGRSLTLSATSRS
jgi:capsular exopolysaccharide synthesis family protein